MFSIWTILRIIYSLLFTLGNIYINQFLNAIEEKKKCPLSKGWRITNGKLLSSLLMIVGLVNIFVPASKFLSTIPLIGSSYVLLFVLTLFTVFFIVDRIVENMNDDANYKCKPKGYDMIINFFNDKSIMECIYYTIGISILFFYL
jgi:hypothetical protein